MTTITEDLTGTRPRIASWRSILAFAAGAALACGVAVGIDAAADEPAPAPPAAARVRTVVLAGAPDDCRSSVAGPC